jgi:cytochrome c oxidase assembly protein subunit 15|tara:strand:+ start:1366 stop:2376 length:1011 start_codon:yes stop_codon:yes gene_type:complete
MALFIIAAGGTIRINDAGESCPDWPQCFGTWGFDVSVDEQGAYWAENPDEIDSRGADHRYTTFEIFSEWFHRLLVGIIAVPVLLNAIIARKMVDTYGKSVYYSTLFSGILLIVQALVGALTVYMDNIDWSVAMHLSLASIFTSSFLYQFYAMRRAEKPDSGLFNIHSDFVSSSKKRVDSMVGAVFTLLILGAWVSTTAGGQYNQGCSVGFPDGWPKCNGSFLPSLDGPGILVQMIHRFGAVLVGLILVSGSARLRADARQFEVTPAFGRITDWAAGLWILNVLVGGSYIVLADMDDFPEWISLLHLLFGVLCFLVAVSASFILRLNPTNKMNIEEE